ncbi:conserved hypothetical protein [Desulforapulum autotrophicum HRM2]|uniref:Uncharacterized protein n=1 Tax=Desulforapulum autotrophicum (strain ATCC 43914 / DSM 3382 / VKM B-1955 / HRM2) TaxID=177437 RepID=C0QK43_DESAH|nr:HAD family hydrolase [Desulforapulum autotrophicum]ACN16069.1 conserved hypothetical protein [Desulforapulum autotrophicum HRM2]
MNIPDTRLNGFKIISFDIFDTLLTRRVVHPLGIFYGVQKNLLKTSPFRPEFINRFVQIRMNAEATAKKRFQKNQANFKEIYQVICDDNALTDADQDTLMAMEFTLELDAIRPIAPMVELLKKARTRTKKIIFTTDMYLNSEYIQKLLGHINVYQDQDTIYASSDLNRTKASGQLFKYILERENCKPGEILHIGNNYAIDIIPAEQCGLATLYYNQTDNTRYEETLGGGGFHPGITSYFFQQFAGATRLARLQTPGLTPGEKVYADIGSNVAGPLLYAFVSQILVKAKQNKLKRLYFIARDGQVLFKIATRIKPFFFPDLELKYIYGSRQSWHLPSITALGKRELGWLLDQQPFLTLKAFSKRIRLDGKILQLIYQGYTGKTVPLERPLKPREIRLLKELILSSELSDIIRHQAESARKKTLAYFRQEGLLEVDTPYGIVDMGWAGRLQESLVKIISSTGYRPDPTGFYFGLTRKLKPRYGKTDCYFFDHKGETPFTKIGLNLLCILEVLTAADHASTVSFSESKDVYKPVFNTLNYSQETLTWINALRQGIFRFLSNLDPELHRATIENRYALKHRLALVMDTLYTDPTAGEAEYLGRFPYCTDQVESFRKDLAPKFNKVQAIKLLFIRGNKSKNLTGHWLAGSRIRSGGVEKKILSPRFFKVRYMTFYFLRNVLNKIRTYFI